MRGLLRTWLRPAFIGLIVLRYGLDTLLLGSLRHPSLLLLGRLLSIGRRWDAPRGERLRIAPEQLGPVFVKFGQMLSTRRDLLPPDVADELAKLQDRVPPFPGDQAIGLIELAFRRPLSEVFREFDVVPVASASIAQVHFGVLHSGREVAVKV